jgi:RNA polymerase sigma-70 factor, ECF subfamily
MGLAIRKQRMTEYHIPDLRQVPAVKNALWLKIFDPEIGWRTDEQLVSAIRGGSTSDGHLVTWEAVDAASEVYARYYEPVKNHCAVILRDRDQAEDAAHDALINCYRKIGTYQPVDKQPNPLQRWLFTIARNRCTDILRKETGRKNRMRDVTGADEILDHALQSRELEPSENAERADEARHIKEQIDGLVVSGQIKPYQRDAFLKYVDGLKYEEIAAELNIPLGTVKSGMNHARKLLRRRIIRND